MKVALITGISGQDGTYLAKLLLDKGYEVHGTSRDSNIVKLNNLDTLLIKDKVIMHSMAVNDFRSILQCLTLVKPDEIYHLAAQSSVGLSFEQPVETMESIVFGTLNILEAIRFINKNIKAYFASSSECYGDSHGTIVDESSAFNPKSPYAVAKSAAFWEVVNYRESYGLFACNGMLFNHESPFRLERYVTKKIVAAVCRIAGGSEEKLTLGNVNIQRDWGWSQEYVVAMWQMLQQEAADDFIIATGETNSLYDFCKIAFQYFKLDIDNYLIIDNNLFRPSEIMRIQANPSKANSILGWKARYKLKDVIKFMIEEELCKESKSN